MSIMTLDKLIEQLQAVRAEHGGSVQVVGRRFGDYLVSNPKVFVQYLARYEYLPERWADPDEEDDPPLEAATVLFIEH